MKLRQGKSHPSNGVRRPEGGALRQGQAHRLKNCQLQTSKEEPSGTHLQLEATAEEMYTPS